MKEDVYLKNARTSVRQILLSCHSRHVLETGLNTKFGDYLASELKVTVGAEQLSGSPNHIVRSPNHIGEPPRAIVESSLPF
jgi:hypothetical protein